jgi:hypothetical protein
MGKSHALWPLLSLGACGAGSYFMWVNDPSSSPSERANIVAFSVAVLCGSIASRYPSKSLSVLSFAFYGLLVAIFMYSSFNFTAFRHLLSGNYNSFVYGVCGGYGALLLSLAAVTLSVNLNTTPKRSNWAKFWIGASVLMTSASTTLWIEASGDTSDESASIPGSLLTTLVGLGGVIFMNPNPARAVLMMVSMSGFWSLTEALQYYNTADSQAKLIIALFLSWGASVFSGFASFSILQNHSTNSSEVSSFNNLVSSAATRVYVLKIDV